MPAEHQIDFGLVGSVFSMAHEPRNQVGVDRHIHRMLSDASRSALGEPPFVSRCFGDIGKVNRILRQRRYVRELVKFLAAKLLPLLTFSLLPRRFSGADDPAPPKAARRRLCQWRATSARHPPAGPVL
jgi:hypothetical protein